MLHYWDTVEDKAGGYYYDKIRINTYDHPRDLRKLLPQKLFKGKTHSYSIGKPFPLAKRWGFKSKIELVAPTFKCLEVLSQLLSRSRTAVSYIEIAKDVFAESKPEAAGTAYELIETTRKKYTPEHFIYIRTLRDNTKNYQNDEKLFGEMTGYFGSKNFKYVPYPRLSKISNDPCVHSEWRIAGASLIARKTGIRSIHDLGRFDIRGFFEEQERKFIIREKIDGQKLGKWLLGWKRRKVSSRKQHMSIGLMSVTFLNVHAIRTYAGLVDYVSKQKGKLKSKRGRKNSCERKFMGLKDYGKFAVRIHEKKALITSAGGGSFFPQNNGPTCPSNCV